MTRYLKHFLDTSLVTPYINEGKKHGLENDAPCFENKYDIVIIVDSIETDTSQYERLLNMGSEIVVLDHHDLLPQILSIQKKINLVSSMNEYDNPNLCGAGVVLKFCLYLDKILNTDYASQYFDLAAAGICADMMSVGTDSLENRYICQKGFECVNNLAIKKINGNYEMNSTAVSFGIAPLVNAANRMNKNWDALNLFLSNDEKEIIALISLLKQYKEDQNAKVDELYKQIKLQAITQESNKFMFFVIEDGKDMSGLIANKALEEFKRPIIVTKQLVNEETGEIFYSGSLRAVGVDNFSKMVNRTGVAKAIGHSNAAGFEISGINLDKFKEKITKQLATKEFKQEAVIDIQLSQKQLNKELINWLNKLNKISGQGFPPITVMIDDVYGYTVGTLSGGKHMKIVTPYMIFIKWNCTDWQDLPEDGIFSAYGTLEQGFFGRQFNYRMIVTDYKISELSDLDDI